MKGIKMINYNKLMNNLENLKLDKMVTFLPNYLESIKAQDFSIVDVLYKLTEEEIMYRDEGVSKIQVSVAGFPFEKEIKDFDFSYQLGVNKQQLLDLESLRFMENKENILFVGSSGVGKTHLAISLCIATAKKRYLTYFISCHDLIMQLKKAHNENRLEQRLKQFCKYGLLIIDEIRYLPVDRNGANLFFQLIAKRYEENSTIITTNQPFSKWGEVFSDNTLANAILDRLLHHSSSIKITGSSYRLKGKIEEIESRVKTNS